MDGKTNDCNDKHDSADRGEVFHCALDFNGVSVDGLGNQCGAAMFALDGIATHELAAVGTAHMGFWGDGFGADGCFEAG